ncbi:MAG: tRNA (N(6)-L-threonylcarbamoyladenosine(37)-C(2))-methylthiotransferase MtaB [Opitutae bacterium]|nr:tRNA (N(6)-L-threonylcarbamoyladenosine(37)-C(2))-methylthiotransferase MtaB [Opitutae bacterium]MCD8298650.1 tRNA (N(6)-L-threonylcarbamoyladenosine(37)-C(2))-methylthiotransferase MtaB [Opitutae bacterium]
MAEAEQQCARKRASLFTLGCRLNHYETEALRDRLVAGGYDIVAWGEPADLAIINTCTVTGLAEAKCRQIIRGFVKANPRGFCAVVGCYSQTGAAALSRIPGVDLIVGNQEKLNVLIYVGAGKKNATPIVVRGRISKADFTIAPVGNTAFTERANLKIQDGCDFMCSFCIIPVARGRARSRDIGNLFDEAATLAARGAREIVLTGVNIGTYSNCGNDIVAVVDKIATIPGIDRIRIGSIEPDTVPDAILERMGDPAHPLMPFLHIPVQSCCARILRDMRRRYTLAEYKKFVEKIHHNVAGVCIGTDIMIGFPGETDAEFDETCKTFMELPLAYCHVFTYSERAGTPAARRPDAVPIPVRQRRSAALRELSARKRRAFMEKYVGSVVEVLFENPANGEFPGYTQNYMRVLVPAAAFQQGDSPANKIRMVKLCGIDGDAFRGIPA